MHRQVNKNISPEHTPLKRYEARLLKWLGYMRYT